MIFEAVLMTSKAWIPVLAAVLWQAPTVPLPQPQKKQDSIGIQAVPDGRQRRASAGQWTGRAKPAEPGDAGMQPALASPGQPATRTCRPWRRPPATASWPQRANARAAMTETARRLRIDMTPETPAADFQASPDLSEAKFSPAILTLTRPGEPD